MAMKHLGESFDIHTSSLQLIFPHNENEIAIATALTGKPLAKCWLHCDRVLVNGKKVDEDVHLTLQNLTEGGYAGREIRYWLLSSHYRKPLAFSTERLDYAVRSLKRLDTCLHMLEDIRNSTLDVQNDAYPELDQLLYDIRQGVVQAMDDDLNISAALASLFRHVRKLNLLMSERRISSDAAGKISDEFQNIDSILNIFDFKETALDPEIQEMTKKREQARAKRDWDLADRIREELLSRGVDIRDQKLMFDT